MKKHRGFTLVELMVVISIIAILAAVAVPVYNGLIAKSRAKEGEQALALLKNKQELYRSTRFQYADNFKSLKIAGFEGDTDTATYGEYTIKLAITADGGFTAEAIGFPLNHSKEDKWSISSDTEKPEHVTYGY